MVTDGVASTIVDETTGLVWARADRASRMVVEYATTEAFVDPRRVNGPAALEGSDFTARVHLPDLPGGQRVFYRVRFQDLADLRRWSEPAAGSFVTAPAVAGRDVSLVFSADTVGQGWGLDPAFGGLQTYASMLGVEPDLFVNLGDAIYADQPVGLAVPLDGGGTWRSLPSPAKAKPAETVDEFRGNYRYNLQDAHMRRFNQSVAQLTTWDDHEVRDNWFMERRQDGDSRYAVASVALLAARARQACFEYTPLPIDGRDPERLYRRVRYGPIEVFLLDYRSYRAANSANRQPSASEATVHLGEAQLTWLEAALAASTARWKVMASSLPIGLVVGDGPDRFEAIANGEPGAPLGRELEIARSAPVHPRSTDRQRDVDHRRCPLRRGAPLQSGAGPLCRVHAVLGVRGRPAACRHLRAERPRPDLRARSPLPRHPCRDETQPAAERRPAVLRPAGRRGLDRRVAGQPAQPHGREIFSTTIAPAGA